MLHKSGPDIAEEDPVSTKPLPSTINEQNTPMNLKKIPMNDSHKTARSLPPNEEALQLMAMGFSQRQAMDALQSCGNDLERATNYLLDSPSADGDDADSVPGAVERGTPQNDIPTSQHQLIDTSSESIRNYGMDMDRKTGNLMEPLEPTSWNDDNADRDASLAQKTIPAPTQTTYDNVQFEPQGHARPESKETPDIGSEEDFGIKYNETEVSILSQYASEYQKAAVSAKRSGNKTLAIDLLRKSKLFTARRDELKELQMDDTDFNEEAITEPKLTNPSPPLKESKQQSVPTVRTPEQKQQQSPAPAIPTPPLPEKDQAVASPKVDGLASGKLDVEESMPRTSSANVSKVTIAKSPTPPLNQADARQAVSTPVATPDAAEIQKLLETLILRQKEYKQAAIHYKNIGNLAVAKEMIRVSKDVLQTAVAVKNGQLTAVQFIKNKTPQVPDMELGSGKPRQVQEVDVMSGAGHLPDFTQLEKTLSYQVDMCHNLELQNRGKTGGSINLGNAFKGLAKAFAADTASLKSAENSNGSLPRFHYQNVSYAYRETNAEIGSNEMVISVSKASQLQSLEASAQDIEAYVQWDLGGWPPEGVPQAQLNKGQTPSASKGGSPGMNQMRIDVACSDLS